MLDLISSILLSPRLCSIYAEVMMKADMAFTAFPSCAFSSSVALTFESSNWSTCPDHKSVELS